MHDFFANLEAAACNVDDIIPQERRGDESDAPLPDRKYWPVCMQPADVLLVGACAGSCGRGRVVLIEGMDLAGKSTLVQNLQQELTRRGIPVRVNRNALCPDNPIAPIADKLRRDPAAGLLETGALFLASHLWDARHFVPPPPGTVHIQDSCWLRTLAYHTASGTPAIPNLLIRAARCFPYFDSAIFLAASIEARRNRLARRERECPGSNDHGDQMVVADPRGFADRDQLLCDAAVHLTRAQVIATDNYEPSELCEFAIRCLRVT